MHLNAPKKTILYILTKSNWGGAQRYVYDLASEASKHGYVPIVACGGVGMLTEQLQEHGIRTEQIHSLERDVDLLKDLRSLFEIIRVIRSRHPTIVHVNSSKAAGIAAFAARLCSTARIIFTVHGLPQNETRSWVSKKLITILTWLTALLAHRVIAVAKGDAELLRQQPFLGKKVTHIQNGINHQQTARAVARQILLRSIPSNMQKKLLDALWIGTIAELTPNKGHRYALEAFVEVSRLYPHIAYIIIGDGELALQYKKMVLELDLQNTVFFTGFIQNAGELLSAFDIYLASSLKEGLPYTIIEALCSGIPIVASCVGGIPDVITDGISGTLIEPASSVAIVTALTHTLENRSYSISLAKNAQKDALGTYTKTAMVTQTYMLYSEYTHRSHTASV